MATVQELERALINADKAGDTDAARKIAAVLLRSKSDVVSQIPDMQVQETMPKQVEPTIAESAVGAGEAALTLGTGAVGGTLGMLGGTLKGLAEQILTGKFGTPEAVRAVEESAAKGAQALTFTPRTQAGQEITQAIGGALAEAVPAFMPQIALPGQIMQAARQAAPAASIAAQKGAQAVQQVARAATKPIQAAATTVREAVGMEPKQAAKTAVSGSAGAAATPLELQRATEAEMAGLRLSEGEVKRSPELLAWEKEKAKTPEYQAPFLERQQENNRAALSKLNQVLDATGAETGDYSNTGIKVVDSLMSGWKAEKDKTSALYNQFRQSPEASFPVNTAPVTDFLNSQARGVSGITGVSDTARQNAVNLGIAQIDDAGNLVPNRNVTLGQLEDFRQSVSAIGAANPNDKRVASIIKRTVDEIGEPIAGQMTRAMRAQRTKQAQKYENRAIVSRLLLEKKGMADPQVPIEEVFNKTILSARPSEIQHIKRVLMTVKDDSGKQAWSELQGATIRHLLEKSESGIGADNLPVISGAKLDKALQSLEKNGKLDLVLGNQAAEQIRNLNQVLKYIQSTPPLTSINNSGTARTIASLLAESAVVGGMSGVPIPVIQGMKFIRDAIQDKKIKAKITKALNYKPEGK
jgi:hypothetical protein